MKNKFVEKENTVEIVVPHKESGKDFVFTIGKEDFAIVSEKSSWGMDKQGTSAVSNYRHEGKMCKITMHKLLTGWKNTGFVDGDRFNLRRENLVEADKKTRRREVGKYVKGNKYRVSGDTVYLYQNNEEDSRVILLDREDLELVKQFTWNINNASGYAQARIRLGREESEGVYMHRLVIGAKKGDPQVDHIDRNRLNNKKSNLRFVTWSENQLNRGVASNNTTGFRGVSMTKEFLFAAQIKVGDKYHRKAFKSFEEAKAQRLEWEKEYGVNHL